MVLVSFGNSDITSEEIIYVVFLGEREEDIMKKKIITALMISAIALTFSACGGNSGKTNTSDQSVSGEKEPEEPTDLTGTWQSEENDGSYQEAVISDDRIEINWVSDGGDTKSIYWIGTYEAPTEAVDEYPWTSERNKEETDTALLASTDDTKEFTYKDGVISYEASALGTTTTVKLSKVE